MPRPNTIKITSESVPISITGESCHLSLPRVHRSRSVVRLDNVVYDAHLRFRIAAELKTDVSVEKLKKKSDSEIAAVFGTFPDITKTETVLAMAAWFYLLCTLDDVVERIQDTKVAINTLKQISAILAGRKDHIHVTGVVPKTVSNGPLPETYGTGTPDPSLLPAVVAHVCRAFRNHVQHLVADSIYRRLIIATNDVWQGMIAEIAFRQEQRSSVASYMKIRVRTIGLAPFFVLIDRGRSGISARETKPECEQKLRLEACVKTAVGIQNDLVGVEKDLAEGEHMNWVLLGLAKQNREDADSGSGSDLTESDPGSEPESSDLESIIHAGACRATSAHNLAVEMANMHLEHMGDKNYGMILVGFIERHLQWAQKAARYKLAAAKAAQT